MKLLFYVAILSAYGTSSVVFEHRESRRPCNDTTVEFTVSSTATETVNRFRLGSTNTLLEAKVIDDDHCRMTWYSRLKVDKTQLVCDFFVNQKHFIEDEIRAYSVLQGLELTLVYLFDLETRKSVFRFYIKGLIYSISANGVTKRFQNPGLSEQIRDTAKQFAQGKVTDIVKEKAKELKNEWYPFCVKWEKQKNNTDKYTIWYNSEAKMVYCSIQSDLPWWHNVSFYNASSKTHRSYTGNLFMTFANTHVGDRSDFTCTITSPNGMVGIQNLTLGSRPTPGPVRTIRAFDPTTPLEASSVPMTENSSEVSAVDSSAVAAVVVVIVILVCAAVILYVFRDRLRMLSMG